jgi:hypothetical protein
VAPTRAGVASAPGASAPARTPRTAPLVAARSITQLSRSAFASTEPAAGSGEPAATAFPPAEATATSPFAPAGRFGAELPPALGPAPPVLARQPAPIAEPVPVAPVAVARESAAPEPVAAAAPAVETQFGPSAPVQRTEAAAPADATPAAGAQSPQSVEEMAARLYDRIRSRLRDELLVDRERAGLVTDVR